VADTLRVNQPECPASGGDQIFREAIKFFSLRSEFLVKIVLRIYKKHHSTEILRFLSMTARFPLSPTKMTKKIAK
jgi:hypothetical protein